MDRIRWGILGTGAIVRGRFVNAIRGSQYGVVEAVASRSLEKARDFAQEFSIPGAFGSYQELIDNPNVDAVYIATPNSEHLTWAIACAEAGKPTLCEKPLASDANEARQMVDAFRSRNVPMTEAFMYRFHPQTERVKALLNDGAIGALKTIMTGFSFITRPEEVAMIKSLAGGTLMDAGCYGVNLMRYMTGEEPADVIATAIWGKPAGVDEVMSGVFVFPSEIVGHFHSCFRATVSHTYDLRGTMGRLAVDAAFDIEPDLPSTIRLWRDGQYEEIVIPPANHFAIMADDFARALLDGRPPRFAPEDAIRNMEAIDRIYAAAGRK